MAEDEHDLAVLQWVYGNVCNVHAEEALQRRRDLLAGQPQDAALALMYHELAGAWRRLWDLGERKKRLTLLRWAAETRALWQALRMHAVRTCRGGGDRGNRLAWSLYPYTSHTALSFAFRPPARVIHLIYTLLHQ